MQILLFSSQVPNVVIDFSPQYSFSNAGCLTLINASSAFILDLENKKKLDRITILLF